MLKLDLSWSIKLDRNNVLLYTGEMMEEQEIYWSDGYPDILDPNMIEPEHD